MSVRKSMFVPSLLLSMSATAASAAQDGLFLWDQSSMLSASPTFFSSRACANDFQVATSAVIARADLFLGDGTANDSGSLESFSGVVAWAVWSDSAGQPGSLIAEGQSANLRQNDTGLGTSDGDVVRVHFELDIPLSLGAGTYWFVAKEGPWGEGFDGTELLWMFSGFPLGASSQYDEEEANPGTFGDSLAYDLAFVLYGDGVTWGQPLNIPAGTSAVPVSSYIMANDFVVGARATFSMVEAWMLDLDDAHLFDTFSGTMSWALYTDAAGAPGAEQDNGTFASAQVIDTGLLRNGTQQIVRVRLALASPKTVAAGTYWLALHEGTWLSPYDTTQIFWMTDDGTVGGFVFEDEDETALVRSWTEVGGGGGDGAFMLTSPTLFASGFETGMVCAWDGVVAGSLCNFAF